MTRIRCRSRGFICYCSNRCLGIAACSLPPIITCSAFAQQPPVWNQDPCGGCSGGTIDYETNTHAALTHVALSNQLCTAHAFLQQELRIEAGLMYDASMYGQGTRNLLEWAEEGSIREDDTIGLPLARYLNHFHDPISDQGLHIGVQIGHDAITWAISHASNDWNLNRAAIHLWDSLTMHDASDREHHTAMTFRAIGHFMHMIEDMGQPWHTRNDAHPTVHIPILNLDQGDGYIEYYARDEYGTPGALVFQSTVPPQGLAKVHWFGGASGPPQNPPFFILDEPLPGHNRYRHFFDTDQYTGQLNFVGFTFAPGLAEYSNFNFFSDDTMFSQYPHPSYAETDFDWSFPIPDGLYVVLIPMSGALETSIRRIAPDSLGIETGQILCEAMPEPGSQIRQHYAGGIQPHGWMYVSLSENRVMESYCQRLLPKAIAYCTDFANFFLRGRLGVNLVANSQTGNLELTITNLSNGTLTQGDWRLLQDNELGERQTIDLDWSAYPGTLANGQSFQVTFPPLISYNGQYTLAFSADGAPNDDFTIEVVAKCFTVPVGACCMPSGLSCLVMEEPECASVGGVFRGPNTTCPCPTPCPSVAICSSSTAPEVLTVRISDLALPPGYPDLAGPCCWLFEEVTFTIHRQPGSACFWYGGQYFSLGANEVSYNFGTCPGNTPPPGGCPTPVECLDDVGLGISAVLTCSGCLPSNGGDTFWLISVVAIVAEPVSGGSAWPCDMQEPFEFCRRGPAIAPNIYNPSGSYHPIQIGVPGCWGQSSCGSNTEPPFVQVSLP